MLLAFTSIQEPYFTDSNLTFDSFGRVEDVIAEWPFLVTGHTFLWHSSYNPATIIKGVPQLF